jgi:hypothetical protein
MISVDKCTVTADIKPNKDKISFSGLMNPDADDFIGANIFIDFITSSDYLITPCDQNFPINGKTLKNGKYSYSLTTGPVKKSLTYDLKTHKFSFAASNLDLSGLGCPLTIKLAIDDYNSTTDADEKVVNGPTVPIPMRLMMGVKDALRVDKCTVKLDTKKSNNDQLTVSGAFAVIDPNISIASRITDDLVITLGSQQFTIPLINLKAKNGFFTCTAAPVTPLGIASATFNFNLCSFTLTIKNMDVTAGSGDMDFCVAFSGFSQCAQITLP